MPESKRPAHGWRRLLPVGGLVALALLVAGCATILLGLTWPFVAVLLIAPGALAVWAIARLNSERAAHNAELGRWEATQAVLAERLRLARDLHDLVSSGLGMITVRAATAAHMHDRRPDEQALLAAIHDVEAISRKATVELRRMLETLREPDDLPARNPADTLASLPEIIAGADRAGLRVRLDQAELGAVSPGTQLAICHVVREGLANSARYAGSTRVDVRLTRSRDAITVTINDEGPGRGWAVTPGAGHGLIGLRERVTSLGGTLTARPRAPGPDQQSGFYLEATIPEATIPERTT